MLSANGCDAARASIEAAAREKDDPLTGWEKYDAYWTTLDTLISKFVVESRVSNTLIECRVNVTVKRRGQIHADDAHTWMLRQEEALAQVTGAMPLLEGAGVLRLGATVEELE